MCAMPSPSVGPPSRFLAEWYRPEITGAPIADLVASLEEATALVRAEGVPINLVAALSVPSDEVFYCLYDAESAEDVISTCRRAGIPAERLTGGVAAHIGRAFGALSAEQPG